MPRKQQGKDVAPTVRGAFIRAVKALEDKGRPLSTVILEQLEKDPLGTLRAISSFVPKEHLLDVDEESPLGQVLRDISGKDTGLPEEVEREDRVH